ncbi:hypothetical protein MNBD_PLANCTO03-1213 [hydrothermal vent metagenome]|uniref:Uncharacterized protein n=1 Tax=hydrothermal vent metagenome TaxID=652676 RepID=A0A3B1DWJ8_9ZZZZ
MAVLPDSRLAQIEWFEQRLAAWMANTAAIGLTPAQVSQLQGEIAAARAGYMAAQQSRNESKSSTVNYYTVSDTLVDDGRDLISTIKAFAEATNNPDVYVLADVPPPAPPGITPPPGTPYEFRVALRQDGSFGLEWKCNNPAGNTVYEIMRSDAGGAMSFVNTAGDKSYIDTTIPANTSPLVYQITAIRSMLRGDPAQFIVQIGGGGLSVLGHGESESDLNMAA